MSDDVPMTPDRIRGIRESLGVDRREFGLLLLGAGAKRADGFVTRLEESERSDHLPPSRAVLVLLRWIEQGLENKDRPPDWEKVTGRPRPRA